MDFDFHRSRQVKIGMLPSGGQGSGQSSNKFVHTVSRQFPRLVL
jgi:hypothetical protein